MATSPLGSEVPSKGPRLRLPERLPDLNGKWLVGYCILWAAFLAIAIAAPLWTTSLRWKFYEHPGWRSYGLITQPEQSGFRILGVFGEAQRLGMQPRSLITAVDGERVNERSYVEVNRQLGDEARTSATLEIETPSHAVRQVTLTKSAANDSALFQGSGLNLAEFNFLGVLSSLMLPIFLVPAAVLLFIRRRREIVPALLSIAFLIISSTLASDSAWQTLGISGYAMGLTDDVGFIALTIGLLVFPDGHFRPSWTRAMLVVVAVWFVVDVIFALDWWGNVAGGLSLAVVAIALFLRSRRIKDTAQRQQFRWAFFGFVAGLSVLVLSFPFFIAAPALIAGDPRWQVWLITIVGPISFLSFPVIALGLVVSILRYRLYDADTVIGRSAAYGVLTLGFVAMFAGTEKLAEIVGERYFEHSIGIAAGAVGAAVAAAVVVPLHNRVHRWAERRFQKPLIRLREGLPECVADLRESAAVEQLVSAVMARVEAGVRSTREAVLLADGGTLALAGARNLAPSAVEDWQAAWTAPAGEQTLDCDRRDPMFPLRVRLCIESSGEPETVGWLLLGPRPDGSFFGRDEREALAHIAGPVARAIHISQLRESERAETKLKFSRIEEVLAQLLNGPSAAPLAAS